jgi:kynurenine formamidase
VVDCRNLEKDEKIAMRLLKEKGSVLYEAEFILFHTGHSALWGTPGYFDGFPVLSHEMIEWVNLRKFKAIGVDAPSFDPVMIDNVELTPAELHNHRAILQTNNTILLENLCRLEEIGNEPFTLCALPLNTLNADGAPARVIAIQ